MRESSAEISSHFGINGSGTDAITVNSQELLATSDIWRPFVRHPETEAAR